ncbi:hypothetical protein [Altericroceibacterium endophyticum]|uniref:hypothetical protein n=1 Tax=Altericroceibacterium endophyticum TaxID=1808508 RepID=UPI003B02BE90
MTGHFAMVFPSERHVPHGFRSAFSTIMNERANDLGRPDDRAVIDLMLAHVPTNKVERAYNRAAYMVRRRELACEGVDLQLQDTWPVAVHMGQPIRRASNGPSRI